MTANDLDLELAMSDLLPAATGVCWESFPVERWEPVALAEVPVYARSVPGWYGSERHSVMLWRTPVIDAWRDRMCWVVGRRRPDDPRLIDWAVADYGGKRTVPIGQPALVAESPV